jgi:hypothetical protein
MFQLPIGHLALLAAIKHQFAPPTSFELGIRNLSFIAVTVTLREN